MCHSQEYCEKEKQQRHFTFMAISLQENVSYQCFVMFPSVGKLDNIFVRNIVSYQCFVMFPSVGKPDNIFVRNIVSY